MDRENIRGIIPICVLSAGRANSGRIGKKEDMDIVINITEYSERIRGGIKGIKWLK